MDKDILIQLNNVSMRYRFPTEKVNSFKEFVVRFFRGKLKYRMFNALDNVSLTVRRGESLGIIGHNGAGKSTLLKIIAEILRPTEGEVIVNGVSALLSLGTGFDAEETGRNNIYLSGAYMGLSKKQIDERYDQIVAFSELGEFINVPLKNYSSGMRSRLAFAIAVDVRPDILLADEVLSTGDAAYARKCAEKIKEIKEGGTTFILVSHSLGQVRNMCSKVLWMAPRPHQDVRRRQSGLRRLRKRLQRKIRQGRDPLPEPEHEQITAFRAPRARRFSLAAKAFAAFFKRKNIIRPAPSDSTSKYPARAFPFAKPLSRPRHIP